MKRLTCVAALAIGGLLMLIQLVPVARDNPPIDGDISAPADVKALLRRACYDCHSHETVWPWYARIAPISWWVAHDVREGRAELNFSTWSRYGAKERAKKLKEIWESIQQGEMPPWYYRAMHAAARLSADDRVLLRSWARQR